MQSSVHALIHATYLWLTCEIIIGPLSPFYACWGLFQVLFRDEPPEPVAIDQELKDIAKREIGLNCERFYNVGVVGAAGTGKVSL